MSKTMRRWMFFGLFAAASPLAHTTAQETAPQPTATPTVVRYLTQAVPVEGVTVETAASDAPQNEYYIGIVLGQLPEIVRKQLKLEHGLVIEEVLPDSPAAKAEFQPHDILLRAGDDRPLKEPADMLKAVEEAKDQELTLTLFREGKELSLKVTPARRPQPEASPAGTQPAGTESDAAASLRERSIHQIEQALAQLKEKSGKEPLGIYFAHPGVVAHANVLKRIELPKNLTVRITREGDKPAQIQVKRDGQEWELTEDKLAELPQDVRVHVQAMLGTNPVAYRLAMPAGTNTAGRYVQRVDVAPPTPGVTVVPPMPAATPPATGAPQVARLHAYRVENRTDGVETKLDLILKKLDQSESKSIEALQNEVRQLRKELDELRGKSPGEKYEKQ